MADIVPRERRLELCSAKVTLNGNRAVIGGASNQFATIHDLITGMSVEFAWPTVDRIVKRDGKFKS